MKLVKQVSLELREGTSDKVYEVDLCEIASDQFLVNFRYGRRGGNLKDGTKTDVPVSQDRAAKIFANLVESKIKKGYRHAGAPAVLVAASSVAPLQETSIPNEHKLAVLTRIVDGHSSGNKKWPLGRAVWKAGQLRLNEAETAIILLAGSGDAMLDYCIAWALGQCGSEASLELLERFEATHEVESVRRISGVALLERLPSDARAEAITECCQQLPENLRRLAIDGPTTELQSALNGALRQESSDGNSVLEFLYLINNKHTRPAVLDALKTVPLSVGYFHQVRHIFKACELRRDGEVFGVIASRFEHSPSNFTMAPRWAYRNRNLPTTGDRPAEAYSTQTRNYLRRRAWRTIQQLGECKQAGDYTQMAVGILRLFSDKHRRGIGQYSDFRWDQQARRTIVTTSYSDAYSNYFCFNQILYGNSPRYERRQSKMSFQCVPPFEPGQPPPETREESFPELWDQHPETVFDLLMVNDCEPVHNFGAKVLKANKTYCEELSVSGLISLLETPYEVTTQLAFEIAVTRFDSNATDDTLILAIANCSYQPAREQAFEWITSGREQFFSSSEFVVELVASSYQDTRRFAREVLRQHVFSADSGQVAVGRIVARLRDTTDVDIAGDVAETLLVVFGHLLKNVGEDVIRDLLQHELPQVQRFAGDLILSHEQFSQHPPDDILKALLQSNHEAVRGIGVRIVGNLPDRVLLESADLLFQLSRSESEDVRRIIRPKVRELANSNVDFGQELGTRLINALLVPAAPQGVPSHTATLLREDFCECLFHIPAETVWQLLQSRSSPAQEIGGMLLPTNVDANQLDANAIAVLGHHEIRSVREAAWKVSSENVGMMQADTEAAARLLDSRWEDTRQFAFDYFRQHFSEDGQLSPGVLVGICDSVRLDTQQFGRELITKLFQDGHGEEYVLKLSEHPQESMQLFASNFLERHVGDNADQLQQLAPYFKSVLSAVNRGRVAKNRSLKILSKVAARNLASATIAADILTQVSATAAISDRAAALEALLNIQQQFPSIATPVKVKPLEVRGAV